MKKTSLFSILGYIYLVLPIFIFLLGFCNTFIAIVGTLVLLISLYFAIKSAPKLWLPNNKKDWIYICLILLLVIAWIYYSGIGALSFQNSDHNCRNPIFELLVTQSWPVTTDNGEYILTYYIGFWLLPAVIGKIFNSITVGYYAQVIWAVIGTFLTLYYVFSIFKKKIFIPVIIFIFFSGLDILGCILFSTLKGVLFDPYYSPFNIVKHIEWWYPRFQFSSFTTQLYWVFNQAIPAWIGTMLLYHQKNNKSIIFLYTSLFISSTLPAIGLLPFVFYWVLKNGNNNIKNAFNKRHLIDALKSVFTFQNIIGGLFILICSYLYLSNNIAGHNVDIIPQTTSNSFIFWLLTFFLLEVGVYIICISNYSKKDPLFYIMIACFLLYPYQILGGSFDFCMRATIPALLILYIFILKTLYFKNSIKNISVLCLIITLIIGSVTPIHEIARSIIYTNLGVTKVKPKLGKSNFFGYTKNNKFLKYIGKNVKN